MRALLLLALLIAGCSKPHEPVRVIAKERSAPAVASPVTPQPSAPVAKLTVAPSPPTPSFERSPLLIQAESELPPDQMGNDALRAAVEARLAKQRE